MNHWFLCARDVMWVVVCAVPIILAAGAGIAVQAYGGKKDDIGPGPLLLWASFGAQAALLALVHSRVIQ